MNILIGIGAALGLLLVLFKIGFRKVLHYDVIVDIALTGTLMIMFAGTFAGMVAAVAGGLTVSIILFVLRKLFKHEGFFPPEEEKA